MAFQWKDRYSLNIPEIDLQHKKLFEIGNHAYEIARLNDDYDHYDEIMAIIKELLEYTKYHFGFEEELMKKYVYAGINEHKQFHSFYVEKIRSLSADRDMIDNDQQKALLDIIDFLSGWISSHILIEDRKYKDYFDKEGISVK